MRVERHTMAEIARKLRISNKTVSRWENGWIDNRGIRHKGWKAELAQVLKDQDSDEIEFGLMLKKERLKVYDRLARMAIEKVERDFPKVTAKTPADVKALLSEVRELCRLISIEKGEMNPGNQTVIGVKTDITLSELQERYIRAHSGDQEEEE